LGFAGTHGKASVNSLGVLYLDNTCDPLDPKGLQSGQELAPRPTPTPEPEVEAVTVPKEDFAVAEEEGSNFTFIWIIIVLNVVIAIILIIYFKCIKKKNNTAVVTP